MRVPSGGARCASARAARPAACRIACCRAWGPVLLLWRHAGGPQPAPLPACTRLKVIHASFGLSVCLLAVYNTMRLETYAKVGAMTVTMHAAGLCARRPRAALLVPDAGPRCDSDWHGGCDLPSPCCMCLTLVMQRACVLTVAPPPDPGRSHAHHLQRPRARLISRSMHACPLLARQPSDSPRPCTVASARLNGSSLKGFAVALIAGACLAARAGAVQRMLLDQLLFAPFFLSTFIASLMTLEVRRARAAGPSWSAQAGRTSASGTCLRSMHEASCGRVL